MRGIKYYSLFERSGYAHAAHAYLRGLQQAGVPVSWHPLQADPKGTYHPMTQPDPRMAELQDLFHAEVDYDIVILHVIPEYYQRCLASEQGKFIVAYSVWETDSLPASWLPLLGLADLVLVPCRWNHEIYQRCECPTPVQVLPHIFEPPQTLPRPHIPGVRSGEFVFYNIGVWTSRKNHGQLIETYLQTFRADEPVVLVLKTSRLNYQKEGYRARPLWRRWQDETSRRACRKIMKNHPRPARIILLDQDYPEPKMEALHQRGDAYVSLAHAEGWGLGAFEAAGRDKTVVMTGNGGPLDFITQLPGHLVQCREIPVQMGSFEWQNRYRPEQKWGEPDTAQAGKLMRQVYEQRDALSAKPTPLGEFVRTEFSTDNVTRRLITLLFQHYKSG